MMGYGVGDAAVLAQAGSASPWAPAPPWQAPHPHITLVRAESTGAVDAIDLNRRTLR